MTCQTAGTELNDTAASERFSICLYVLEKQRSVSGWTIPSLSKKELFWSVAHFQGNKVDK